jgi:hypothetical protein
MNLRSPRLQARLVFGGLALFYAALGLTILNGDAIYSGDIGVKFVQARALAAHDFTSLDLPYPGAFLDPERLFFAMRPPFVLVTATETQAIFSTASSIVQAAAVWTGGVRGMIAVTILAGIATLWATARLSPPDLRPFTLLAVGLAGPLWFYAVSGWEHAQAVALGAVAFAVASRATGVRSAVLAGAALGLGITQRDEVMLLAPGLLGMLWVQTRDWRALAASAAAAAAIVLTGTAVDVWWFHRPPAAHLRHAVHIVRGAWLGTEPGADVPSLRPFTLAQRYETVVQYWILGYGNDRVIAWYAAGLAAALIVWRAARTSAGLLVWLAAIAVLAALDVSELIAAPKWVPGLLRVSPYFVFAILPPPAGRRWTPVHTALVLTAASYLVLAFGGADTTGGKGLGPRLLLPIVPMLAVASVTSIRDYLQAPARLDRTVGAAGVLLGALAVAVHAAGTIPAYVARNRADGSAMMAVKASAERIVVSDDLFTAQLLMPLYFRKVILVADGPGLMHTLGEQLDAARIGSVMLVAREHAPAFGLAPLRRATVEQRGRFVIEHWTR